MTDKIKNTVNANRKKVCDFEHVAPYFEDPLLTPTNYGNHRAESTERHYLGNFVRRRSRFDESRLKPAIDDIGVSIGKNHRRFRDSEETMLKFECMKVRN